MTEEERIAIKVKLALVGAKVVKSGLGSQTFYELVRDDDSGRYFFVVAQYPLHPPYITSPSEDTLLEAAMDALAKGVPIYELKR